MLFELEVLLKCDTQVLDRGLGRDWSSFWGRVLRVALGRADTQQFKLFRVELHIVNNRPMVHLVNFNLQVALIDDAVDTVPYSSIVRVRTA